KAREIGFMRRLALVLALAGASSCGDIATGGDCGSCATGCCLNGVCQPGTAFGACGKGGAGCNSCQTHQVCRSDQTCGVDPNGVWLVQPVSATVAPDNNGAAWDPDNSPADPKVSLYCPSSQS